MTDQTTLFFGDRGSPFAQSADRPSRRVSPALDNEVNEMDRAIRESLIEDARRRVEDQKREAELCQALIESALITLESSREIPKKSKEDETHATTVESSALVPAIDPESNKADLSNLRTLSAQHAAPTDPNPESGVPQKDPIAKAVGIIISEDSEEPDAWNIDEECDTPPEPLNAFRDLQEDEWLSYARLRRDVVQWLDKSGQILPTSGQRLHRQENVDRSNEDIINRSQVSPKKERAPALQKEQSPEETASAQSSLSEWVGSSSTPISSQGPSIKLVRRNSDPIRPFHRAQAKHQRRHTVTRPSRPAQIRNVDPFSTKYHAETNARPTSRPDKGKDVARSLKLQDSQPQLHVPSEIDLGNDPVVEVKTFVSSTNLPGNVDRWDRCFVPNLGITPEHVMLQRAEVSQLLDPDFGVRSMQSASAANLSRKESQIDILAALRMEESVMPYGKPIKTHSLSITRPDPTIQSTLLTSEPSREVDCGTTPSSRVRNPPQEIEPLVKSVTFHEGTKVSPIDEAKLAFPKTTSRPQSAIASLVGSSFGAYAALTGSVAASIQARNPTIQLDSPSIVGGGAFGIQKVVHGYLVNRPGQIGVEAVTLETAFCESDSSTDLDRIELSAFGSNRRSFAFEAMDWASLAKFLMQHSNIRVSAASTDRDQAGVQQLECGSMLTFMMSETGQIVLRLVLTLLSVEHPDIFGKWDELSVLSHVKSNFDERDTFKPSTFFLPDPLILPSTLSSVSTSLFMLRHLAFIALSTQPSNGASPSYLALRKLGSAIQASSRSRPTIAANVPGMSKLTEEEDLLTRFKDKLKARRTRTESMGPLSQSTRSSNRHSMPSERPSSVDDPTGDLRDVFGIGSTPTRGLFTTQTSTQLPHFENERRSFRHSLSVSLSRTRSRSRSRPTTPTADPRPDSAPSNDDTPPAYSEVPRLGFGTIIRPRRTDPNGEVSDLSEDEARWLPTLAKHRFSNFF